MEEQELDSPLNDPIDVEGDPVDSLAQHATDGKEVTRPFYSSTTIMNQNLTLHIPMLKAQSRFNQMLLVHHQLFLLFR